jgi:hypothetical protein
MFEGYQDKGLLSFLGHSPENRVSRPTLTVGLRPDIVFHPFFDLSPETQMDILIWLCKLIPGTPA